MWSLEMFILNDYLSGVSLLSRSLANSDFPQESIIGIQHWIEMNVMTD